MLYIIRQHLHSLSTWPLLQNVYVWICNTFQLKYRFVFILPTLFWKYANNLYTVWKHTFVLFYHMLQMIAKPRNADNCVQPPSNKHALDGTFNSMWSYKHDEMTSFVNFDLSNNILVGGGGILDTQCTGSIVSINTFWPSVIKIVWYIWLQEWYQYVVVFLIGSGDLVFFTCKLWPRVLLGRDFSNINIVTNFHQYCGINVT